MKALLLAALLFAVPTSAFAVSKTDVGTTYEQALADYGPTAQHHIAVIQSPLSDHTVTVYVTMDDWSFTGDDALGQLLQSTAVDTYPTLVFETKLTYNVRTTPQHALVSMANGATNVYVDDGGPFIVIIDKYK